MGNQLAKHFRAHIKYGYSKVNTSEEIKLAWNIITLKIEK